VTEEVGVRRSTFLHQAQDTPDLVFLQLYSMPRAGAALSAAGVAASAAGNKELVLARRGNGSETPRYSQGPPELSGREARNAALEYKYIRYEVHGRRQDRTDLLDRPGNSKAQSRGLLVELDQAFAEAERDDGCARRSSLAGTGAFLIRGRHGSAERSGADTGPASARAYQLNGGTRKSLAARCLQERHYFYRQVRVTTRSDGADSSARLRFAQVQVRI